MAQPTSPSTTQADAQQHDHRISRQHKVSDSDVPIDPNIAQSSPTYPPPYSPYNPQGHDMAQYHGQPQPPMYRPDWPPQYAQPHHGLPGPYSSPATTVSSASPAATAGPRPGQVRISISSTRARINTLLTWGSYSDIFGRLTRTTRSILLYLSRVHNSTSVRVVAMKKLSACTNVGGTDVRRLMAL